MATYQPNLGFDTLGFAQALIARGFEQKQAEAMAVVTRDYVISGMATNEFVHAAIREAKAEIKQEITKVLHKLDKIDTEVTKLDSKIDTEIEKAVTKLEREITASENRMMRVIAAMLAFVTGIILAGIPIIQTIIAKLG